MSDFLSSLLSDVFSSDSTSFDSTSCFDGTSTFKPVDVPYENEHAPTSPTSWDFDAVFGQSDYGVDSYCLSPQYPHEELSVGSPQSIVEEILGGNDLEELLSASSCLGKRTTPPVELEELEQQLMPPAMVHLLVRRKTGKHNPYGDESSVGFSKRNKVGKSRQFTFEGELPPVWAEANCHVCITADDGGDSDFCLTQTELPLKENKISSNNLVFVSLRNAQRDSFYLHLVEGHRTDRSHTMTFTVSLDNDVVSTFEVKDLYSAGHKHETGKKQINFYSAQNCALEISLPSGHTAVRPRSK